MRKPKSVVQFMIQLVNQVPVRLLTMKMVKETHFMIVYLKKIPLSVII